MITERNQKEKLRHSIVKWWNVHYMTPEELHAQQKKEAMPDALGAGGQLQAQAREEPDAERLRELQEAQEDLDAAQEILERLRQEAEADELNKQREIERAKLLVEENYNPTTGAYSGAYGMDETNAEQSEQIEHILSQKDEELRDLIEHTGET